MTIGSRAVVGMGSVVLHDIPAGEVWAGVPAKRLDSDYWRDDDAGSGAAHRV